MGCDIHMFIEYKVGDSPWEADKNHKTIDDDGYKYLEQVNATGRNYYLFAALAGVRGNGPAPKGLPKDVSEIIRSNTKENEDYGDDHSHSYSSLDEFKEAMIKCEMDSDAMSRNTPVIPQAFGYLDNGRLNYYNLIAYVEKRITDFKLELEAEQMLLDQPINTNVECRFVYWFDN